MKKEIEVKVGIGLAVNGEATISTVNNFLKFLRDEGVSSQGISDGYHAFEELYYHRMILFSLICKAHKDKAWKSKQHHDGTMFDGYFIVGIDTPEGRYSYHYDLQYWDDFDVKELERAPEYDGHKPSDIDRLKTL